MKPTLGKQLIVMGLVIAAIGAALTLSGRIPWLGRLPGDIHIQRGNIQFFFPLATCLLLSALLTLISWLLRK
jgi:hypothetical protein